MGLVYGRPRIGLDLDGVVYKFQNTANWLLKHFFGYDLGEWTEWDYVQNNIKKEHWDWLWKEGVQHGLFRHGHLYPGTIEAVKALDEIGDIVVITARPKNAVQDTLDWLAFHKFPVTEVHIVGSGRPKSHVKPECHYYVDDSWDNAQDLHQHTKGFVLLWSRKWNESMDLVIPPGITRVDNWQAVIEEIQKGVY